MASVTNDAPPDRFQASQVSTVPMHSSPRSARAIAIRDLVEQPARLGRREHRIEGQAGPCPRPGPQRPTHGRARTAPCCAGIASSRPAPAGAPLARSQTTHGLALVGDAHGRHPAGRTVDLGQARIDGLRHGPPQLDARRSRPSRAAGSVTGTPHRCARHDAAGRVHEAAPWCWSCPGRWRGRDRGSCAAAARDAGPGRSRTMDSAASRMPAAFRPTWSSRNSDDPVGAKPREAQDAHGRRVTGRPRPPPPRHPGHRGRCAPRR